jgi:hypothetical protein
MEVKLRKFILLNIIVILTFAIPFVILFYTTRSNWQNIIFEIWDLLVLIVIVLIFLSNCFRNILFTKGALSHKSIPKIKENVTRVFTVLFSIIIFLLAYGLFEGYQNLRSPVTKYNIDQKISYLFQLITVIIGAYIAYNQNTLLKLITTSVQNKINKSIEEIGS